MADPTSGMVSLAALLAYTGRLQRERSRAKMAEHGLYRGQAWYLAVLAEEDGVMQSQLASRLQMQPATVSNALQRMERDGLVERRPDPRDQRVSRVYLTDRGRKQVESVRNMWTDIGQELFEGLDDHDRAELQRLLLCVLSNLGIQPAEMQMWHIGAYAHTNECGCPACQQIRQKRKAS